MLIAAVNKNAILISIFTLVLLGGGIWWLYAASLPKQSPKTDEFAKCLTQKGVEMYGAYWCPHCQNQKKLFGESFKYITYIECTQDPKKCEAKKINGYPTWIFKNGERISGEAAFQQLAQKSSCAAPSK